MSMTKEDFLTQALKGYEGSYDIERCEGQGDLPLAARAAFHVSESGFVLIRKAEMWSANSDEYVFFFTASQLTDAIAEKGIQFAYEDGLSRIDLKNNRNHMCTRVVVVFICDEAEDSAVSRIKACRLYKSFQFSLKGWMEVHTAVVDLGKNSAESNRYGRETANYLNSILNPQKRKKNHRKWNIFKEMLQ